MLLCVTLCPLITKIKFLAVKWLNQEISEGLPTGDLIPILLSYAMQKLPHDVKRNWSVNFT